MTFEPIVALINKGSNFCLTHPSATALALCWAQGHTPGTSRNPAPSRFNLLNAGDRKWPPVNKALSA